MAGISAKSLYGLSALLTLSKQYPNGLLQIRGIAEASDIPQGYLEQILPILKKFGFLESVRGANGGYRLSKAPDEIVLYDVIAALEGAVCESQLQSASTGFEHFLDELNREVRAVFSKNLLQISEFVQKAEEDFAYVI